MAKLGFELAKIAVLDENGVGIPAKTHVFSKQAGGTIEASISGIAAEPTSVYASNVQFFTSQKGTGEIELSLTLFEMSDQQKADILGLDYDPATGETSIGVDAQPPYVSVILKTQDPKTNEDLYFGLTKGKLGQSDEEMATLEGGGSEPNTEAFTGTFSARESDGKAIIKKRAAAGEDVSTYEAKVFNTTSTTTI